VTALVPVDPTVDEPIAAALRRGGFVEITTTGRRSGLPRRIPIVFHVIGGRFYISGMPSRRRRAWLVNLESEPRFTLHLVRGVRADVPASARPIVDETERRAVLTHVARAWGRSDVEIMVRLSPLIEFAVGSPSAA
jgi:deazaflavin-dependent oxidoreductase (nitroreductase family)